MTYEPDPITDKANAAFRLAMLDVIETCKRTKTPLITSIDGEMKAIPYDEIEKYIDVSQFRPPEEEA